MKRVFIVHERDFNPAMHWYLWLRKKLEKKVFHVEIPGDLAAALTKTYLRNIFDKLSYTYRKEFARGIEEVRKN